MRRVIWIVALVVGLVALCGCVPSYVPPPLTSPGGVPAMPVSPEPSQPSEPLPPSQVVAPQEGEPPIDRTWISPGKVMVGNFYVGARAEWPLLVHYGGGLKTETKQVTTEDGEVKAGIPLNGIPFKTEASDFTVLSDREDENLRVVSYSSAGKVLVIEGFKPDATRIVTVTYTNYGVFSVYYREPDHVGEGYVKAPPEAEDWVIIADCTPVIAPETTKEIMVAIEIPEGYNGELPPKWEFWIGVKDTSQTGMVRTELCNRWLISMKS